MTAAADNRLLLERIDAYLHTAPRVMCDVVVEPPFTLYFNRETDSPFLSYARPSDSTGDWEGALPSVMAEFQRRGRVARWEWIDDLYPDLAPALVGAGIRPEITPLMWVTPEAFRREDAVGFEVRRVELEDDFGSLIRAQRRSFGMEDEAPSESEKATIRAWLERGGCFYAACSGGAPVGAGGYLPIDRVAEIAGVGTVPEFRQRGLAGAVTSALVEDAFRRGCDCLFLTAGDERAVRLYRRLGFEEIARGMAAMAAEG